MATPDYPVVWSTSSKHRIYQGHSFPSTLPLVRGSRSQDYVQKGREQERERGAEGEGTRERKVPARVRDGGEFSLTERQNSRHVEVGLAMAQVSVVVLINVS